MTDTSPSSPAASCNHWPDAAAAADTPALQSTVGRSHVSDLPSPGAGASGCLRSALEGPGMAAIVAAAALNMAAIDVIARMPSPELPPAQALALFPTSQPGDYHG